MSAPDQPIRISLFAPDGRMGRAIARVVEEDAAFVIDQEHGDVLVDFSAPDALDQSLERGLSSGIPILVGTTGLDDAAGERIAQAAKRVAILRAPNTSLGIAVLSDLVERAARVLGPDWDIEIAGNSSPNESRRSVGNGISARHRRRAGSRQSARRRARTMWNRPVPHRGRDRFRKPARRQRRRRSRRNVPGQSERLILSHRAENRLIFARGALAGARFLIGRPAGLYSMRDVIESL